MSDKFQNKYRISSARWQHWDYGINAAYFVTICTKDREHFFGKILDGQMEESELGRLAQCIWTEIPKHFSFVELDAFVVMPNHVHGIILIQKQEDQDSVRGNGTLLNCVEATQDPPSNKTLGQHRFQNQGKGTLSAIIGAYKSAVSKFARPLYADFAWQPRFHDHIIRNEISYNYITHYIVNNPQNWVQDTFYT